MASAPTSLASVAEVHSRIAITQVKYTTELLLGVAAEESLHS